VLHLVAEQAQYLGHVHRRLATLARGDRRIFHVARQRDLEVPHLATHHLRQEGEHLVCVGDGLCLALGLHLGDQLLEVGTHVRFLYQPRTNHIGVRIAGLVRGAREVAVHRCALAELALLVGQLRHVTTTCSRTAMPRT
jgi:hypothetical protein